MLEFISELLIGFYILYYIVFFITMIYYMIYEEWFCRNRLPEWYDYIIDTYSLWRQRLQYRRVSSIDNITAIIVE